MSLFTKTLQPTTLVITMQHFSVTSTEYFQRLSIGGLTLQRLD